MADGNAAGDYYDDQAGADETAQRERMEELARIVRQAVDDDATEGDESSAFRQEASDRYYGREYGDEVNGRSKVISRDVLETVEWVLAQLLRIFTGDKFCEFTPTGPEDVEPAKQQTDYVNHVLMQDCSGTLMFYDWFKGALLHRTGLVHWGYLDTTCPKFETFTGLNAEQLQVLLVDEAVEVSEITPRDESGVDGPVFDVRLKRLVTSRKLHIDAIAREDFVIDKAARSIDDSTLCGHRTRKTKSDLRGEGVPESILDTLQVEESDDDGEAQARDVNTGDTQNADEPGDEQRKYDLWTLYVKHDLDGDGYAELLRVRYVGTEIIETEPAMEAPYADLCPIRTPHRFEGLSLADVVMDIQRIKTVLWRQALDNLYAANRPQREVVEGKVNPEDIKKTEIGAAIRVREPGMVRDLAVPLATDSTLGMIAYIDQVREERTGTSAASQGRDADQIHDTAKGMAMAVSQAQMRIELIARLFAEGGVKRLFVGLYNAIVRNQDGPRMVRLRGKFIPIDPREWRERNDVSVTVGLGSGTREAQIATLQMIATMQQNLLSTGTPIVNVQKLKHTLTKLIEAAGFRDAGSFLAEPDEIEPPKEPPKSDAVVVAEISAQLEREKMAEAQAKQQAQFQLEIAKLRSADMQKARDHEVEMAKLGQQSRLDADKLAQDDRQFYDKLLHDAVIEREKLAQSAEEARAQAAADEAAMKALGDGPAEGKPEGATDAAGEATG